MTVEYFKALDGLVAPSWPCHCKVGVNDVRAVDRSHVSYADNRSTDKDFYAIYGKGLYDSLVYMQDCHPHEMLERGDPAFTFGRPVKPEFQEFLLSVVAHEVRHRLQYREKIQLVTAADAAKIWRCKAFTERMMRIIADCPDYGGVEKKQEFDAVFVGAYIRYEIRRGRAVGQSNRVNEEYLRKLLMMTPETLFQIERNITG